MHKIRKHLAYTLTASLAASSAFSDNICSYNYAVDANVQSTPRHQMGIYDHVKLAYATSVQLVKLEHDGRVLPRLAKSWVTDPENRSVIFNLAQNCGWSDGTPINADDVVEGFRHLYKFDAPSFSGWSVIKNASEIVNGKMDVAQLGVEKISDHQVKVTFTSDVAVGINALAYPAFSPISSHKPANELLPHTSSERIFSGRQLILKNTNDALILSKNPHFCEDLPSTIESSKVHLVHDQNKITQYFLRNQIDSIENIDAETAKSIVSQLDEDDQPQIIPRNKLRQLNLYIHPFHPALAKKEVRLAISAALDYTALSDSFLSDYSLNEVANTVFHDIGGYEHASFKRPYSDYHDGLRHLQKVMKGLGYSEDNRAKISISTFPLPQFERKAFMIASMLNAAYFDVSYKKSKTIKESIEQFANKNNDINLYSWSLDYPHVQNSFEGISYLYDYLKQTDGAWIDYFPFDSYLQEFQQHKNELAQLNRPDARLKKLQDIEKFLVDWALVLPLLKENSIMLLKNHKAYSNDSFDLIGSISCKSNES